MPHPTKLSDFDPTWCQMLINSPSTETIPWPTLPDANTTSTSLPFSLFTQTLNTLATIRASHALWDSHGPVEFSESGQAMLLVSLGGGMNYFPNTLHGGMVAALIDEAMGLLVYRKMNWVKSDASRTPAMTAQMNISLRGRIVTPGVYLVRAWADETEARKQGKPWTEMRKISARAVIEDSARSTLAEAAYLMVRPSPGKL